MRSCAVCSLLVFFLTPKGLYPSRGPHECRGTHTDESHFSEESKPPQSESYRAARITASIIDLCEAAPLFPVTVVELPTGAEDFVPVDSDSAEWFDLPTPVRNQ